MSVATGKISPRNNIDVPKLDVGQQASSFSKRLDAIAAQLKQLSADIKSQQQKPNSQSATTQLSPELPTGKAKLAAWQKPAGDVNTVDIKQGDSLSKIAAKSDTSIDELMALNGIKNKDRIKAGRKIIVSEKKTTNASPASTSASTAANENSTSQSEQVGPTKTRAAALPKGVSARDRDTMIRTVIGEANNQGPKGQEAVAHVLMNRSRDSRFPSNLTAVAKQRKQFSAWNSGVGGNSLVRKYNPGSIQYERAAKAVDRVLSGQSKDPTGGATHYYSPAGMKAHVARGEQSNLLPRWLQNMNNERSDGPTKIGGHVFTGKARIS